MAEGYCWVCDRPVEGDPCPDCGTPQFERSASSGHERLADEVLDTSAARRAASPRNPLVVGLVVMAAIVVIVLLFQSGASIS